MASSLNNRGMNNMTTQSDVIVKKKTAVKVQLPSKYKVLFLNDDVTPMQFVVTVLITVFNKNPTEAEGLTMEIHHQGSAVIGVYTKEIAETKQQETLLLASDYGLPLQCIIEEDAPEGNNENGLNF